MHKAGTISRQRVTELIRPYHIKQLTSDTIDEKDSSHSSASVPEYQFCLEPPCQPAYISAAAAALTAKGEGEKVCLCKKTFLPTDSVVMREMDAIISLTSAAVHVVTICQSLGIPALLSLEKSGVSLQPEGRLTNSHRDGDQGGRLDHDLLAAQGYLRGARQSSSRAGFCAT